MLKVGITGGIGSGKSAVSKLFGLIGIPVLDADKTAKILMETDPAIINKIIEAFGTQAYSNGRLNRPFLAQKVFGDQEQIRLLNRIVHPVVIQYGHEWMQAQHTAAYVIKEAAIFFESGSYKEMDIMIGVYTPLEIRIERVIKRDGISKDEVMKRVSSQMNEEEKMKKCNFVILNDGTVSLIRQVEEMHEQLLSEVKNN